MISLIRHLYGREIPADPTVWHPWTVWWPIRLRDGRWSIGGEMWRRKTATGWEYDLRDETFDEWLERQG